MIYFGGITTLVLPTILFTPPPPPPIMLTIYSDASLEDWGATDSTGMVGGRWDEDVAFEYINSLELFAAKLAA